MISSGGEEPERAAFGSGLALSADASTALIGAPHEQRRLGGVWAYLGSPSILGPPAPIVEEDPLVLEDGSHATVLTINDRMCRWPIGDPAENEFHFCGRKPKTGSPYCEAHARKAYQPQQQRRNDKGRMVG